MASTASFPPDINLGPLTTTFTAPADCQHVTLDSFYASSAATVLTTVPVMYTASSCYPSGKLLGSAYTASTLASYNYHDEHIYFSPGICPSGWSQQAISSTTVAGKAETTALCCEPGFTVTTVGLTGNGYVWRCYTNVTDALSTVATTKFISARQNLGKEPACAIPCLTSAVAVAGCGLSDQACQCGSKQAAIQTAITPCLLTACNAVDIGIFASIELELCSSFSAAVTSVKATVNNGPSSPAVLSVPTTSTSRTVPSTTPVPKPTTSPSSGTTVQSQLISRPTQQDPASITTSVLISVDPVFIKYRDGDLSSSGGLSTGAKIGLGVAIPLVLVLVGLISCVFIRKRKQRAVATNNGDEMQHDDAPPDYPSGFKAELHDPATNISSSDVLGPVLVKSELQAPTHNITSFDITKSIGVPELESTGRINEHAPTEPELGGHEPPPLRYGPVPPLPSELDISPISPIAASTVPGSETKQKQVDTGPLTTPEEFAILPSLAQGRSEEDDEELEYQERRLRERREILAEKERIARKEEELRRLRRERKGGSGGGTSGLLG